MFFMGEETGAQKRYTFNNFLANREDIFGARNGNGKTLFRFYQDLISLSGRLRSIRSHNIDILHQSNGNRVIAFKRWSGDEEVIIVASFNNTSFANGYGVAKDSLAIPTLGGKRSSTAMLRSLVAKTWGMGVPLSFPTKAVSTW